MAARKNRFNEDFQKDAVHQVIERGYSVVEVAQRLGISPKTLYGWKAKYAKGQRPHKKAEDKDPDREIAKLKAELKRVTEERDILKKAAAYFAKESG